MIPVFSPAPSTHNSKPRQDGLEWKSTLIGLKPRWTEEPDIQVIERIARKRLGYTEDEPIDVTLFAQGASNKLYKIKVGNAEVIMRVSLPVYPRLKTESEVATLNWVRQKAPDIPVPGVIAFDSNAQNELGFEWIIMSLIPGKPLSHEW
jgi:Ser/Thr protein kinase RdoA (MazF antagonist)